VLAALNGVFDEAQRQGDYAGFRLHTTEVDAPDAAAGVYALPRIARPPKPPKAEAAVATARGATA
jgi:ATP-dependent helicase/nuclease subunit A